MTSGRIKSGKVKKIAPTAVTADRYNFIQLSETEPDLGVPAATGYVLTSNTAGTRSWVAASSTLETSPITFVGDDSTGTGVNLGETFKIAGSQNITTAVSGDTLTITGPNLTNYIQRTDKAITVVGDDSTGTDLNIGETVKIAGSGGITTSVSGDTLTISGSNTAQGITFVGDDSTGTRISDGETIKIAGSNGITTAVSGDILTISVSKNLDVNEISSTDSSAIQVNDGLNVRGTLTATGLVVNGTTTTTGLVANGLTYPTVDGTSNQVLVTNGSGILSFTNLTSFAGITFVGDDSTGSTINTAETLKFVGGNNITTTVVDDVVTITGSKNINVNEISSTDSTAIQVNDGLNVSGPLTTSNFSSPSATITGGTIDNVAIGGTTAAAGAFTTLSASTSATLSPSGVVTINPTTAGSINNMSIGVSTAAAGTFTTLTATTSLTANTIVTNEISSTDSTAIQIIDGVNVIGNVTAYTFNTEGLSVYRNNISTTRSDDNLVLKASGSGRVYVEGNLEVSGTAYLNDVSVTGTATLPVIKTNLISSDDSTAVQVADGMNVSGTLSADVLDVNEISSADSSAIQINDAVNISGTLNAKTIVTNDLISEDSTAINVLDGMNVSGTLSADVLDVNEISSGDSTAIQINDSLNVSGTLTTNALKTDSTATISGTLTANTIVTNDISSTDSTAIQINDGVNISGTLSADILDVNEISSGDSTAIQINDAVNISGTLNAKTLITTTISSEDSTAIQINGGINVTGSVRLGGLQYPIVNGENGQVLSSTGTGSVEWATLTGGGGSNVAADSVTFTGFGSNNIVISDPNISVDLAGTVIYGAVDDAQAIGTSPATFDTWSSDDYDSAFYITATLNNTAVEYGTASISVATNGSDAFVSSGGVVSTGTAGQLTYSAGYTAPNVTVYGTGASANNTASYLRINLGDDTVTSSVVSPAMAVSNSITVSATTVSNNTSVGDAVGITTAAKIADQFTGTSVDSTIAYDSAFYFAVSRNEINNQTGVAQVSLVQDGTDVYASTSGVVLSGAEDPQVTYSASLADLDGDSTYETVRLLATGPSATNSVKYHRINLGSGTVESAAGTAQSLLAAEEYNNTVVNTNVQVGEMTNIGTNEKPVDVFTTSSTKSAFYFAVTRDENSGEVGTAEISLVHDGVDAFVSSGNVSQSGATNNQVTFGGNIDTGKVRLTATGTSNLNSVTYYRMGLGTSTTAASSGNVATLISTGLGSTSAILDSWSKTTYRAARYYISATSANGEVENIEVRLFHDGTTSYINTFNNIYSGNNSLMTLTTNISGGNVRLLASCNFNTTVKSYRIRLGDSESGSNSTYTGLVGSSSISSTTGETFDTFSGASYTGVHYTVSVSNSTLNTAAMYDVFVVHDGVDAYVMTNYASSDDTAHLNFTATYSAGTITVKAATYNGTSYTLNAYRNHLLRGNGGYRVLDSWSKSTYRSAKYYVSISGTDIGEKQNIEVLVTHDGTTPYIVTYNTLYTGDSALMDIDAIIESSTFKLLAKNPREKNFTVRMYRVILEDSPTNSTTTYNKRIAPTTVGSSAQAIDTFTSAAITGAHYIVTAYNSAEGTASVSEVSVVTNADDAYVSSTFLSSKNTEQLTFTADYNSGTDTVTLYAASTSGSSTTVSAYRTNLLRSANAGLNTIDSWSKSSYRGAKYYISAKDTDTGEVSNVEAIVVHDGSVAYVAPFNQNNTDAGDVPLITLEADISGGNVRLLANAPTSVNYDVRMYRVRLQDSETANLGTYTKLLNTVTVTSDATTIDEFSSVSNNDSSAAYVGCYYFVTAYNATEGTASAYDVYVASEGVTASVASSFVSSKAGPMLTFDVEHTNGLVTLSASSNSGGNTTVNIYRHQLPRPTATEAFKILDSWNKTIYRGAKYFITVSATNLGEYNAQEVAVVHNGSDAYNTVYNMITTGDNYPAGLVTISTDISSNLVRLKAVSNGEAVLKVTMVRHRTIV